MQKAYHELDLAYKELIAAYNQIKDGKDEYAYMIDSRYNEIRVQLEQLSAQVKSFISAEHEFWESVSKRKSHSAIQGMQSSLNASLSHFSHI